jgi:hypothetical protein
MGAGLALGLAVHMQIHGSFGIASPRLILPLGIWLFYLAALLFRLRSGLGFTVQTRLMACGLMCLLGSLCYELTLARAS